MLSWSDWQKNVLRSLNLECKPFSSSMVKTDLIKRTQKIESMHNGLILIAISWEILLSQVLSVLLQLYYSGSYFQKLKERRWRTLSGVCQNKQIEIMKEDTLPFIPHHYKKFDRNIQSPSSSRVLPTLINSSPHPPPACVWYVPK